MKAFEYARPATLKGAVALKAQAKDDGRLLAGGTDLIAQMKEGRQRPSLVIDAKRVRELRQPVELQVGVRSSILPLAFNQVKDESEGLKDSVLPNLVETLTLGLGLRIAL